MLTETCALPTLGPRATFSDHHRYECVPEERLRGGSRVHHEVAVDGVASRPVKSHGLPVVGPAGRGAGSLVDVVGVWSIGRHRVAEGVLAEFVPVLVSPDGGLQPT